jgi:hypothetical protein
VFEDDERGNKRLAASTTWQAINEHVFEDDKRGNSALPFSQSD